MYSIAVTKKFEETLLKHDITNAPYHVGNIFDEIDDMNDNAPF